MHELQGVVKRKREQIEIFMESSYLTKLKAEMEGRLGCGIEVVEDRDLGCSCKIYQLDGHIVTGGTNPPTLVF